MRARQFWLFIALVLFAILLAATMGRSQVVNVGAPITASYVLNTPNALLSNAQVLTTLATGAMINNQGTGLISIYGGAACPAGSAIRSVDASIGLINCIIASGGSGAPTTSTYLLQVADGSLPSAQAMGALSTALVINATSTGVQSAYTGAACPSGTAIRSMDATGGVINCVTASGGTGAPTTSKYLLQQADGSLPNAQSMGVLTTGLVQNTTSTGVQSIYAGTSCPTANALGGLDATGGLTNCIPVPLTATYLLQTANAYLTSAQVMASLDTGITINATATGVQTIYAGTNCGTISALRTLDATGGMVNCLTPAPPAAEYLLKTPNSLLPNAQSMSALGTGITINTTGTGLQSIYVGAVCPSGMAMRSVDATGGLINCITASGGTGAPTTSKYLLQQADASLPSAQDMSALSTALVINTTSTGVQSAYTGTTCPTANVLGGLDATGGLVNCVPVPLTATYLLKTANAYLTGAQVMASLGTGITINTTATGVQSIYGGTTCPSGKVITALDATGGYVNCITATPAVTTAVLPGTVLDRSYVFFCGGILTTTMICEETRVYVPAACTPQSVQLAVTTAPTTSSIIVDVNECSAPGTCTTLFTNQGNRPTVAATALVGSATQFSDSSIALGNFVGMDIDQIGSGTAGSNLTITLICRVQ